MPRIVKTLVVSTLMLCGATAAIFGGLAQFSSARAQVTAPVASKADADLEAVCQPEAAQRIAATLSATAVTVKQTDELPAFPGGAKFFPAQGALPAFCQVEGSFVTNPKTGKTSNFLATLPAHWNGKYLQLGCSGHCGQFFVSNPAFPSITVTTQGYSGEIISKGYATFATDEGHTGMAGAEWAVKGPGQVDEDAIEDFYYRADKVLADMGKAFTRAFYTRVSGEPVRITRSYFCGCSGGGRDAFIVAAHFPEKFDGIIAGSAYNLWGTAFSASGSVLAAARSPDAGLTAAAFALIDQVARAKCDKLDGVVDGVIQNPAACDFRPERDLPRCEGDKPGDQCLTKAQIDTVSSVLNGVTDERGELVQPGFSVGEFKPASLQPQQQPGAPLWDAALTVFIHKNDPNFSLASIFSFRDGGPGQVTGFHTVVPRTEVARVLTVGRMGDAHDPKLAAQLIKENRKLLIWHNFDDGNLSPYMSINYYKALAKMHGGYAELQKNVRLFMLPGTTHCSITSVGPNSFDALTAMENWVEKGRAPDALLATVADRQFSPGAPKAEALKYPTWTAKLCKFPEMARYSGKGDTKDAANWTCPANDRSLLRVGESGRQAGVLE